MKKLGLFVIVLGTLCLADAATNLENAPVMAQDCRGACGWQHHNCELGCPPVGTSEGDACLQSCLDAYRACTDSCD